MKPLAILAFTGLVTLSGAQGDVKRALQPFYDGLNRHILNKRFDRAEALLVKHAHPQFARVDMDDRRQSFREYLDDFRAALGPPADVLTSKTRIDHVATKGGITFASTAGQWSVRISTSDGKPQTIGVVTKTRDTWVKVAGVWKVKEVKVISEAFTLDGKPWK